MSLLMWVWLFAGPAGVQPVVTGGIDHLVLGQNESPQTGVQPNISGSAFGTS